MPLTLELLWRRHSPALRRYAQRLSRHGPVDADDILADACLKLHLYQTRRPDRHLSLPLAYIAVRQAYLNICRKLSHHIAVQSQGDEALTDIPDRHLGVESQLQIKQTLTQIFTLLQDLMLTI